MTKRRETPKSIIPKKRIELDLIFSEFEIPPMRDALVIGKRAPIGSEAAKQMADSTAPEQFVLIPVKDRVIEAILVRKKILHIVPREHLIPLITEEARKIITEEEVVKIKLNAQILVRKIIEI